MKGDLYLFAFDEHWNAGWASGGFLADSVIDGKVLPASQQQWLSRNSKWGSWANAVWNMVFVGCENTPAATFPKPAYTVVDRTSGEVVLADAERSHARSQLLTLGRIDKGVHSCPPPDSFRSTLDPRKR